MCIGIIRRLLWPWGHSEPTDGPEPTSRAPDLPDVAPETLRALGATDGPPAPPAPPQEP